MRTAHHLINGQEVSSHNQISSIDPSSGEQLGLIDLAEQSHVDAAVVSARSALESWRDLGVHKRTEILARMVELLRQEYGQPGESTPLKSLIFREMGKRLPEADVEVAETADILEYFVHNASSLLEDRHLDLDKQLWPKKRSVVEFEPVGVVGVIKPWNYPLELPMWSIAPALIAGNTIVFKPSEHSGFVGAELGRLFTDCGLPNGVLNVLQGDGSTGRLLVEADGLDMISFTGSVRAGREVGIACASRHRRCSLELGGNDAAIVAADANLELASNGLVWGSFANSGQVCVRPKRVFVHQDVVDEFLQLVLQKTFSLKAGVDYGPLVSETQRDVVEQQIQRSLEQGALAAIGGGVDESRSGFFFEPTILTGVQPQMAVMREECFGPVMPIVVVTSMEEAVEFANDSDFGLGASVWTENAELGLSIARQLEVGMVWLNDVNVAFPQAPWGGLKESGPGVELGEWGLREYVSPKHINFDESNEAARDWWFPYPEA